MTTAHTATPDEIRWKEVKVGMRFIDKNGIEREAASDAYRIQGFTHIVCVDGSQHTYLRDDRAALAKAGAA